MKYDIKDLGLADQGRKKAEWAEEKNACFEVDKREVCKKKSHLQELKFLDVYM